MTWIIILAVFIPLADSQSCDLSADLIGSWTTTGLGSINITSGSPSMTTALTLQGLTGNLHFDCMEISGPIHIFRSTSTITVFSGTLQIYAYMCMDITMPSANSAYYYLRSPEEVGFSNLRMIGSASTNLTVSEVCTDTTLGIEQFHTMIKDGSENAAIDAVNCPDVILGQYSYTYTDSTGSYCANSTTSKINTCNDANLTTIQVNNTGCTEKSPFFSTGGVLGCLLTVHDNATDTYFTSLYNLDENVTASNIYRFICIASKANTTSDANGTIYVSMIHTDCAAGQTAIALPTGGALLVLEPDFTCVPTAGEETSYLWLIPVMLSIALFIVLVIVGICLFFKHKRYLRDKSREKKVLIGDEHPLGEVSISLDAPPSLERNAVPYDEFGPPITHRTPRSKRRSELSNPLSESSLHLDFKTRAAGSGPLDPFTEMDGGMIIPMGHISSRAAKSMENKRQRSFIANGKAKSILNGKAGQPLPITDGREQFPNFENPDMYETLTARSVKSMKSVYSTKSKKAPSISARSTKARSIKAPSIKAPSVAAPSVKAMSIRAPSVAAPSVRAPSVKAPTIKSTKTMGSISKPKRLTRSSTTTRIGSITKRLTSPRKKALNRSSTVILPPKDDSEPRDDIEGFMNGEMAITRAPSDAGRSRYSSRTRASHASKTPRQKGKHATVGTADHMTDEDKIDAITRANSMLVRGTINPDQVRQESFFNHQNIGRSVRKPHASKKPWKG